MEMLLSRQKPWLSGPPSDARTTPRGPAWCPGGRTGQKALRTEPSSTRSTASHTAPAACRAASKECSQTAVSPSRKAKGPAPCSCSQRACTLRTYDHSCTRNTSASAAGCVLGCIQRRGSSSCERSTPRSGCSSTSSRRVFSGGAEAVSRSAGLQVRCRLHSGLDRIPVRPESSSVPTSSINCKPTVSPSRSVRMARARRRRSGT
mmetsp:Transcript_27318/g.37643  ORF Transcript_27318/g.37643 Transcript_27318/m.37643 type:complete len:205 (-) Transcript_27318:20-634(-)